MREARIKARFNSNAFLSAALPRGCCLILLALAQAGCLAQTAVIGSGQTQNGPLDRVIAVVNTEVILASDLDLEVRLSRLIPGGEERDSTEARALDRLTTRALIEQQILQDDPRGMVIDPVELQASLKEMRQNLPACQQHECATPEGWTAYLRTLGLTPPRVDSYWSNRMAVLRFIEQRFRAGIRITPEEIQKYYDETMLPQYARREDAPPLDRISPRIQEILLQQQVNTLLTEWLKTLQDQGQVEVLDPVLKAAVEQDAAQSGAQGKGGGR